MKYPLKPNGLSNEIWFSIAYILLSAKTLLRISIDFFKIAYIYFPIARIALSKGFTKPV